MKFKHSKLYFVISSLLIGILLIGTVNFIISFNVNKGYPNKLMYMDDKIEDQDIKKFYKSNSVSISVIKNSYTKLTGTAWIKEVNQNYCTFATNLHVLLEMISYNSLENRFYLDHNKFDEICVKYFEDYNDSNIKLARIENNNWSIKLNGTVLIEREIPMSLECSNTTIISKNDELKKYINNGFIDYIELVYKIPNDINEYNSMFNEWLINYDQNNKPVFMQQDISKDLDANDEIYVAGFPSENNQLKWVEKKIKMSNVGIFSALEKQETKWIHPELRGENENKNVHNKLKNLRNVSKQLVLKKTYMGHGASGSMVVRKNKSTNAIEVVGIWWGTYGSSNGGVDLFYSDSFKPYNLNSTSNSQWSSIDWPKYNINELINNL